MSRIENKRAFNSKSCEFGVFDLDGTIVNSRKLFRFFGVKIPSKFFPIKPDKATFTSRGVPLSPKLKKVGSFLKIQKILEPLNRLSHRLEQQGSLIKGGKSLGKLDQKLYCSTTSPKRIAKERLKHNGILKAFTLVLGNDDGSKLQHLEKFARENSLSLSEFAEKAYFVSDGPADLNLCNKADFKACIGIDTTLKAKRLKEVGADFVISNLEELNLN